MTYATLALATISIVLLIVLIILVLKKKENQFDQTIKSEIQEIKNKQEAFISITRQEQERLIKEFKEQENKTIERIETLFKTLQDQNNNFTLKQTDLINESKTNFLNFKNNFESEFKEAKIKTLTTFNENIKILEKEINNFLDQEFKKFNERTQERLNFFDKTLTTKMDFLIKGNKEKLDEIEGSVNKKLNDVLETTLKERFKSVFDNLNVVNTNITELKSVTSEIGKVKALLSNVKTKGVIGEQQLLNIIQDILPPDLYKREYQLSKTSQARVDFVVKILDNAGEEVYLPIDSKFITTDYNNYLEALEDGDKEVVNKLRSTFLTKVRQKARDISQKYIQPPVTTSYALMFLPSDYLYYEVIQDQETIEFCRAINIELVSPSTLIPMLNTIKLGFTSYRISKQSQKLFDAFVKFDDDFKKYIKVLEEARKSADKTSEHLEKLAGIRTKAIQRTLENINELKQIELKEKEV